MNYQPFPTHYWTLIQDTINAFQAKNKKLVAAFDADGTLWDTDLGENFFQYQIDQRLVELPPNPMDYYFDLKKLNNDPRTAFMWLAQINKNKSLDDVRQWSQKAFDSIQPSPIFSEQKKLVELLLKNKVNVYVVTASIKWAVEPGARALGIPVENIVGVETQIINNVVTDLPIYPVTYRHGKVEALLLKTGGEKPFLCSGNSMGDFELLETSQAVRLAVSAASRDDVIYKTESELILQAQKKNWLAHRFI